MDPGKEGELAHAQGLGHVDLRVGVRGVGDHALHLARCDAGVGQGGVDRLDGQAKLAAPGVLGELGGPDAHHRGVPGKGMGSGTGPGHHSTPLVLSAPAGKSKRTVPVTWSPKEFEPLSDTSMAPRPPASRPSSFFVTEPVRVMVSFG